MVFFTAPDSDLCAHKNETAIAIRHGEPVEAPQSLKNNPRDQKKCDSTSVNNVHIAETKKPAKRRALKKLAIYLRRRRSPMNPIRPVRASRPQIVKAGTLAIDFKYAAAASVAAAPENPPLTFMLVMVTGASPTFT